MSLKRLNPVWVASNTPRLEMTFGDRYKAYGEIELLQTESILVVSATLRTGHDATVMHQAPNSPTQKGDEPAKNTETRLALAVALGSSFGTSAGVVIGVIFDEIALGVALGAAFGASLGCVAGAILSHWNVGTDRFE